MEEAKRIVTEFYHAYGIEKDAEKCRQFFGDKYIQHNPHVQDGVEHWAIIQNIEVLKFPPINDNGLD